MFLYKNNISLYVSKKGQLKLALSDYKKQTIKHLIELIQTQGVILQISDLKDDKQKLEELDVLLDTVRFLNHYEENTKILKAYSQGHKYKNITK